MFERFTEEARQVVVRAQEEARRLHSHHIGTEHLVLGLLWPGGGAQTILGARGVTLEGMRAAVEECGRGRASG